MRLHLLSRADPSESIHFSEDKKEIIVMSVEI